MAILIRIGRNVTYKGHAIWDPIFQNKANDFDRYIEKEIKRIEKEVIDLGYMKKGGNKDVKCHHWVGGQLKALVNNESLHQLDRKWVINSIEYHAPYPNSPISHKNRTKNRKAYNYDLFMNEIPHSKIDILKWGEWATIFDTNAFHSDKRSMDWFKNNLDKFKGFNSKRNAVRKLTPMLNKNFCRPNRDLTYLTDEQFSNEINNVFQDFLESNPDI